MELIPDKIEAVQLSKKELKMIEAGASREEAYAALARGLKARKSIPLKDGSVIEEDDMPTQLKAAETAYRPPLSHQSAYHSPSIALSAHLHHSPSPITSSNHHHHHQ